MATLEIEINELVVDRFKQLNDAKRMAHAYLFIGPKYVGKSETALKIAEIFSSKIDTHILECNFGEKIKIDEVRQILSLNKLRPFQSERKVFLIKNVEHLTLESANALLKTLEEPAPSSLLILTTSVPERLLPTIQSRCHRFYFPSPSKEFLAELLKKHYHEDNLKAHFIGSQADGSLGVAQQYRERNLFELKNEWITQYIYGNQGDAFIKNYLKEKETTKDFLDILLTWIRDSMLLKTGVDPMELTHLDRMDDLKNFSARFSVDYLNEIYEEIVKAHKLLADNLNIKLPLLIIKEKLAWGR